MGKCRREWRKLVKKLQRKKKRQNLAKQRCKDTERDLSPKSESRKLLEEEEQRIYELNKHDEEEKKWLERERIAQEEFSMKMKIKKEQEVKMKIKLDKLVKDWYDRLSVVEKEIDNIISNNNFNLKSLTFEDFETHPGKKECLFYKRTGCCRYNDGCYLNHKKPVISNILLFRNLFHHYALNNVRENEHGSDQSLEFEDKDVYEDYCEFFDDIYLEVSNKAKIVQLKVCRNNVRHLCGNVYIQLETIQNALQIYRQFSNRYYAGNRIHVEFVRLVNWKSAICGQFLQGKCPRLTFCNYLHIFKNPYNLFNYYEAEPVNMEYYRNWRWSESP